MRYLLIFIFALSFSINVFGDIDKDITRAYKKGKYKKVCELSEDVDLRNLDSSTKLMVADSYYYLNEVNLAAKIYSLVLANKDVVYLSTKHIEKYFELLLLKKRYNEIIKIFPRLSLKKQENKRIYNIYESAKFLTESKNINNKDFKLLDVKELNSINIEYGIHFLGNNILCYTSPGKNVYNILLKGNNNGLLREYAEISEKRYTLNCLLLNDNLELQNIESNEELSKFNIYTRRNFVSYINYDSSDDVTYFTDFSKGAHTQIICRKKKSNGKFKYYKCSFCKKNFDYAMPCLSKDGKTIYYISNDISGYGGWDIFKSEQNINGKWGPSINMGSNINTEFDEMYPFVGEFDELYFSSNGHKGFGGFDIYRCIKSGKDIKILNLLSPVNTEANDFSFIISQSRKRAFCFRQTNNVDDIPEMIRSFVYNAGKEKVKDSVEVKPVLNDNKIIPKKEDLPIRKIVPVNKVIVKKVPAKKKVVIDTVPDLPVGERLSTTTNISFQYNKYETQSASKKIINDFIGKIKNIGNYDILLSGYADFTGNEHYNLWLSHKRIESVADYLIKSCGIQKAKIFCIAYGEYDISMLRIRKREKL